MQKNKLPSIISILILTLLTSVVWVSLNVYRAFTEEPSPSVPKEVSLPLTPTLDQDTISKIDSAIFLDDSQIPENTISATPVPTTTSTPVPTSTPTESATPSATPTPAVP